MYFTQTRKATLWTTKWEPCIWVCLFLPTFDLCCKTTCPNFLRLGVHGLLLPLKSVLILFFLYPLSYFLFLSVLLFLVFQAWLLSLLKIRGHVLRSLLFPPFSVLLLLWGPQSLESISIARQCVTVPPVYKIHILVVECIKTLAFYLVFTPVLHSYCFFFRNGVFTDFLMYICWSDN